MSKVTIGLIGYGYWGPNLLRNYMESASATVKWVCDISPKRLDKAATRYPSLTPTKTSTTSSTILRLTRSSSRRRSRRIMSSR